mmetsp:Transcript_15399/g.10784  ORF Transcript_15399/g.10784 Transcript_15399/m.10784 type:complete len:93 (+) Transcript_15399:1064-1342(+)
MLAKTIKPIDCAMLMTSFCRVEMYDLDFLRLLESIFIEQILDADGETLVTMFNAHASWSRHIIDETFIKRKQKKRVFNMFKKYTEQFYFDII